MARIYTNDLRIVSENVTNMVTELNRASKHLREMTLSVENALGPHGQQIVDFQQMLGSIGQQFTNVFEPFRQWSRKNHRFIEDFRKAVQEWPRRQQKAIITLANHGWYLDPDMPITASTEFAQALDEGKIEEVTKVLTEYFREKIYIEERIEGHCPRRMHILREAFNAHREGKYNLSIPVFLAQADGIWWDEFSKSLFQMQGRNLTTQDYIEEHQSDYFLAFFDIFKEQLPLWMSGSERNQSFDQLNRHLVSCLKYPAIYRYRGGHGDFSLKRRDGIWWR